MPNKIFDTYQGNTIKVNDGKCYTFVQQTLNTITDSPSAIISTYGDCIACDMTISSQSSLSSSSSSLSSQSSSSLSSSKSSVSSSLSSNSSNSSSSSSNSSESSLGAEFLFPEVYSGLLGDPHYTFGASVSADPALASFNVDDNISEEELVWFTSYKNSNNEETILKYTCQPFDYTLGGYSIDSITVQSNAISAVYSLTPTQDACLKNGLVLSSPDTFILGDALNVTISPNTIDDSGECAPTVGGNFSFFTLDTNFNNNVYNVNEIGGAFYSIWKKASELSASVINNPSQAGIDGIGDFTGVGRSTFTAVPSGIRVPADINIIRNIAQKQNEMAYLSGSVDFDWDPLMSPSPNCTTIWGFQGDTDITVGANEWEAEYNNLLNSSMTYIPNWSNFDIVAGVTSDFNTGAGQNQTRITAGGIRVRTTISNPSQVVIRTRPIWAKVSARYRNWLLLYSETPPLVGADLQNMTRVTALSEGSFNNTTINTTFTPGTTPEFFSIIDFSKVFYLAICPQKFYDGSGPFWQGNNASNYYFWDGGITITP